MSDNFGQIVVCGKTLTVKNYHCVTCGDSFVPLSGAEYYSKENTGLRLYVHVTDRCNAACSFCRRNEEKICSENANPMLYRKALEKLAPYVYSVGFTGGEPMLFPELVDELVGITSDVLGGDAEIDLVTNGTNLDRLPFLKNSSRLTTVHISRHAAKDEENRQLMGFNACEASTISEVIDKLNDPCKIVLNCVLQKGGVDCVEKVADYLDLSATLGVRNNSFIAMFRANDYCREHYISPEDFSTITDDGCLSWNEANPRRQFAIWNRHRDNDYCKCLSGSYESAAGRTRYYFRCPGTAKRPDYCRQFVYTADNLLTDGFGGQIIYAPKPDAK